MRNIYYWSFLSSLLSLSTWNLVFAGESQEEEEVNSEEALAMSSPSTTVSERIVVHVDIVFFVSVDARLDWGSYHIKGLKDEIYFDILLNTQI